MAEMQPINRLKRSAKKFNKKATLVDLTPMVDLGFLLITFFVFTNTMARPTVMNLNMPLDTVEPDDKICESCALTLLLDANNTIQYYEGIPGENTLVKTTNFSKEGIRDIILQKKKQVQQLTKNHDEITLIIKSSRESSFSNFVDIIDEVAINNIRHYYVTAVDESDEKMFHLPPQFQGI